MVLREMIDCNMIVAPSAELGIHDCFFLCHSFWNVFHPIAPGVLTLFFSIIAIKPKGILTDSATVANACAFDQPEFFLFL